MTCHSHPWGDPMGLACLRTDPHTSGHIYSGTWAPDAHDTSEEAACSAA
jgi:hypothetical protein